MDRWYPTTVEVIATGKFKAVMMKAAFAKWVKFSDIAKHDAEVRKEFVEWCDKNIDIVATIATATELLPLFDADNLESK